MNVWGSFSSVWSEFWSYEPTVAGSSPARSNIQCFARMAEWSKAVDLSPTISGCAGSNPASRTQSQ